MHFQTVALVKTFKLSFPDAISDGIWNVFEILLIGLEATRPECAGLSSFEARFILSSATPIIVAFLFAATFAFLLVAKKHPDRNLYFACYGSLYYTFSVAVADISFSLFKCYSHPGEKQASLVRSPEVLCGSDTWLSMLVIGVLAILAYVVVANCCIAKLLYQAPMRFHDEVFQKRWKFLFVRLRPDVWWWGQPLLLRGVALNISLALVYDGLGQIYCSMFVLLVYLTGLWVF